MTRTSGKHLQSEPSHAGATPSSLPPELRRAWMLIAGLTLFSVLLSVVAYFAHWSNAFYLAVSPAGENFTDFTMFKRKFDFFHTARFFGDFYTYSYPAPLALVYKAFFLLGDADLGSFLAVTILALLVPAALFARALQRRGIAALPAYAFSATILLCSWPAFLIVDRANVEIFVWIALAVATWAFATGRAWLAAALFGVAASFKLFPFVFLALFLSTRRWKPLLFGVAVFLAVSWISLATLGPTTMAAYVGISEGLQWFHDTMMAFWRPWESGVDHSLFNFVKFVEIQFFHHSANTAFLRSLTVYTYATAIGGALLYILRIRKLPLLNQILAFSIASILFTAFSGDGTLVHLYYGFALLAFLAIDAHRRSIVIPGLSMALLLLAFLSAYESFFVLRGQQYLVQGQASWFVLQGERIEGQVKCIALTWLMFLALRYPFGPALTRTEAPNALAWPDASRVAPA